jgi:hypothetical protein
MFKPNCVHRPDLGDAFWGHVRQSRCLCLGNKRGHLLAFREAL